MKKVSILFLMIFLSVFLTACSGNDNIRITEEESDAIAQYCSYLLIKYDKNHRDGIRLLDVKDLNAEIKERKKAEEEANRPKVTPSPVPTPTPAPDSSGEEDITPTPESVTAEVTEPPEPECVSIAEAGGIEGFAVEYVRHGLVDSYTNTGEYYSFSAPPGKKLCVVEFSIINNTGADAEFNAVSYGFTYRLFSEGGKAHGPELSLFADDIQFFSSNIKAGGNSHATLIFYVTPDEVPAYLEVQGEKKFIINFK